MKNKKIFIYSLVLVIIDQITKLLIKNSFNILDTKTVIKNFFYLTYTKNNGAAFSSFSGYRILLIIISVLFLIFLINYIRKEDNIKRINSIAYTMIIGGIIGNLIDRLFIGSVIDFLSFKIFNYYFPVFNLADTFIVIGVIILIIDSIGSDINEYRKNNSR